LGGVAVGGLTETDARTALDSALGGLEDGRIELVASGTTGEITYEEVRRTVDRDGMLVQALGHGRGGTRFEEAIAGLQGLLRPTTIPITIGYDRPTLAAKLTAFRMLAERQPVDARARAYHGTFSALPGADGLAVDTTAVQAKIDTALLDPATPAVISYEADSRVLPPTTSDADVARAIDQASRIARPIKLATPTRSWTLTSKVLAGWMTFEGSGASYGPAIDTSRAVAILKNVKKHVAIKPTDATFVRDRAGRVFGVSASSAGRALDVEATVDSIVNILDGRAVGAKTPSKVVVSTKSVGPDVTTSEATKKAPLVERIGTWTTYYQVSAHNGFAANITVPARKLNGVVVRPGETFDFWRALGEVSFRTGYRLGGAIVGGHSVEGKALAGGICAASTTLFNAAARGGLQIVARQPHWYYITRYPLGLDATVSDSQTMRFRNDTAHPVMIRSQASPGVVRFEIWSVPNGRTTTWSRPIVTNVVRGYDTTQYTSALRPGEQKRVEYPVDGKDVSVTRTVRDGAGRVVHRDTFISHYHRMVGILQIGR
ncbi:MAG TPA: VanW family protein, partial [Candidatus Limnocylindrales bacterium]|nr:VanW family protein [Candidatus Limnocylindrales bacterium]